MFRFRILENYLKLLLPSFYALLVVIIFFPIVKYQK